MKYIGILLGLALLGAGAFFLLNKGTSKSVELDAGAVTTEQEGQTATTTDGAMEEDKTKTVLGTSAEERDIIAYHYGEGEKELLFVGGIHGGYSWNTALVAYELMNHLSANPNLIPENLRVTVVPVLNPDGLVKVAGTADQFSATDIALSVATEPGRFNGNTVDLNRNFDCDWKADATWQSKTVSGGASAFSEPESKAIRAYIESTSPVGVVVWYSAAGGVYASNCHSGVLPETNALLSAYASASGYPAHTDFDFYEVTGDMTNWLAKERIPAISVLLSSHTDTEWEKNRKGAEALLNRYR